MDRIDPRSAYFFRDGRDNESFRIPNWSWFQSCDPSGRPPYNPWSWLQLSDPSGRPPYNPWSWLQLSDPSGRPPYNPWSWLQLCDPSGRPPATNRTLRESENRVYARAPRTKKARERERCNSDFGVKGATPFIGANTWFVEKPTKTSTVNLLFLRLQTIKAPPHGHDPRRCHRKENITNALVDRSAILQ